MTEGEKDRDFERIRRVLGKSVHFNTLPADELDRLARLATVERYDADQMLHPSWRPANKLWVVLSGAVRVLLPIEGGATMTLAVIGEGNYYSAGSFVHGAIIGTEAYALRRTELAVFDMKRFHETFSHDPVMARHVLGLIYDRLFAVLNVYVDAVTASLPQRLARRLLGQLTTEEKNANAKGAILQLSQSELARMLGASRTLVNAELRRLEAAGAIQVGYREIFIKDLRQLVIAAGSAVTPI